MYPHQAERLTEILDRHGLEALIASREANVAYISGFRGLNHATFETPQLAVFTRQGTGLVVTNVESASVVADGVDVDRIACFGGFLAAYDERPDADVSKIRGLMDGRAASPIDALARALDALGVTHGMIGLDEGRVSPAAWDRIATRLSSHKLVPAANHFLAARRVKGPWEIQCLERALHVAEAALNEVIATIEPGTTEREATTLYQSEVVKRGGEPLPAIIAGGSRSWIPLPRPTDRALRARELVRFDVGCVVDGYQGTVARTAVTGEPDERLDRAFTAVDAALGAAIAVVKPGVSAARVHGAAVDAARAAGLETFVASHIGHAIGLEAYERPKLAPEVDTPLEAGEVLRPEIRHFQMGWAGLHVKETILVTTAGARSMNRSQRGLVVLT